MRHKLSRLISAALLLLSIPAAAQSQAVDVETYRLQLRELASTHVELAISPEAQLIAAELAAHVEQLTNEDLAFFIASGADLSQLLSATREFQQLADEAQPATDALMSATWAKSAGFPDAQYSFPCGEDRPDSLVLAAARAALALAKTAWSASDRACNETIVILGEGGNTSLLCIIADGLFFLAEEAVDTYANCKSGIDSLEIEGSYDRLGHLHGDLETVQADISSDMRLRIEENLMESAPTFVIVSYQLPEAFGGHLELTAMVVQDSMDNTTAAGQSINFAQTFFDQAEALRASESYKQAYLMYRRAYREIGRLP